MTKTKTFKEYFEQNKFKLFERHVYELIVSETLIAPRNSYTKVNQINRPFYSLKGHKQKVGKHTFQNGLCFFPAYSQIAQPYEDGKVKQHLKNIIYDKNYLLTRKQSGNLIKLLVGLTWFDNEKLKTILEKTKGLLKKVPYQNNMQEKVSFLVKSLMMWCYEENIALTERRNDLILDTIEEVFSFFDEVKHETIKERLKRNAEFVINTEI